MNNSHTNSQPSENNFHVVLGQYITRRVSNLRIVIAILFSFALLFVLASAYWYSVMSVNFSSFPYPKLWRGGDRGREGRGNVQISHTGQASRIFYSTFKHEVWICGTTPFCNRVCFIVNHVCLKNLLSIDLSDLIK